MFKTPSYSYLSIVYHENLEEKIGYTEAFGGLGISFGPLIGGILFSFGGFIAPFIFNAITCVIILVISIIIIPS